MQYPGNSLDDYDFENTEAASIRFRVVAYQNGKAYATGNEFTITWTSPISTIWNGDTCTVTLEHIESGVIVIAACYDGGKMVKLEYLTESDPTAILTGDNVKVFFLKDGTYVPVRRAMDSYPGQ